MPAAAPPGTAALPADALLPAMLSSAAATTLPAMEEGAEEDGTDVVFFSRSSTVPRRWRHMRV
jgi:hypothetical protein